MMSLILPGFGLTSFCRSADGVRKPVAVSNRHLQTGTPYKVELLLALDFFNDTVALQFENSESIPSTNASIHFCYAVNTQVSLSQSKMPLLNSSFISLLRLQSS
jgi:hypothetical protein